MIDTIFFDFDGVLTNMPSGAKTTFGYISDVVDIPEEQLCAAWHSENIHQVYVGAIDIDEAWTLFCKALGQDIDPALRQKAYEATQWNHDVRTLCMALKDRYTLGIITDNPQERTDAVIPHLGLADIFTHIIVSATAQGLKMDTHIFEYALMRAGTLAERAVFIDNKEKNLTVPKEMGFHTYYFDFEKNDVASLLAFLQSLGVEI